MSEVPTHGGRLLVATQGLVDPNFAGTVILLLEHDAAGAFGVVLNRPGEVPIADALPPWASLALAPPLLFEGGPVQPDGVLALGRTIPGAAADELVVGIGLVDLTDDPVLAATRYAGVRLFAGYAGWSAGQLELELGEGGWFVVDVDPGDVVTADPRGLWRAVLARQGGLFLTVAEDPTLN